MSHFYFSLTNVEADSLFKKEISLKYPQLKLSFNKKGFYTFKSDTDIPYQPSFARVSGRTIGKYKLSELSFSRAWVWKISDELEIPQSLIKLSQDSLFKVGEKVTLVMMLSPDEYWVGEYVLSSHHFQTPGEISSILQREVPSRAYYKIAEVFEAFDLVTEELDIVLELGSAPGGASLFLLEQGLRVIGVDPADMDSEILKSQNFKHWKKPFETIEERDFKGRVDWLVSDINLPPQVVLNQIYRFLKFLDPKGVILTLKINEDKHLTSLDKYVENFRNLGFKKTYLKYLPSHRKEISLIALRS